jgi:ubiquinone biosynthesis protein
VLCREVAVKVRLPGVVERVEEDLSLIRATARLLDRHSEAAQLVQIEALADELEVHLRGELDFEEEAHNAELIRSFAEGNPNLVVPEVIRPYVTERVLVLEFVQSEKVTAAHGLDQELARELFRFYVRQVTVEGLYHADPHRGNVLLTPDGRLALLDFGLIGRLDDDTRRELSLLLLAVAQNRADDVADLILRLSLTTLGSDEPGFVHDIRRKLPRYHWRPLKHIRAGEALADLQRVSFRHGIRLPPAFALVGKDPLAGRLNRAAARPRPRSGEAAGGGRAHRDARRGATAARAKRARVVCVYATRRRRPASPACGDGRRPAGVRDGQDRRSPNRSRWRGAPPTLGRQPDRGR